MRLSCFLLICCCSVGSAQSAPQSPAAPSHLFTSQTPLTLRLETNLRALKGDRGAQRTAHPGTLHYGASQSPDTGTIAVKLRTRGIFRLKTCGFPPIRLDLPSHKVDGTPFAGEDRLKLVTHCQGDRVYERNLLREYALYRVFNALTDSSFRVRLAHMTYVDSARHDTTARYGFLIESDAALARRMNAEVLTNDNVYDPVINPSYMTLVAVYQYLIGNTDWSVWKRHNIAIFQQFPEPRPLLAVPYDFDFSGAVNASYAAPPEQLKITTVRERAYRGFCQPDSILMPVLDRFRAAKDSMYAAVRAVPDLPERDARDMLGYFAEFFQILDNKNAVSREFIRGCRPMPR